MNLFKAKYYSDQEIMAIMHGIIEERNGVEAELASDRALSEPERMAELARRLHLLNQICHPLEDFLKGYGDVCEIKDMLDGVADDPEEYEEIRLLLEEYRADCLTLTGQAYLALLEGGYLDKEVEDERDLEILRFIDYAGPEYAWRLGINIGLDVEESRRRLEILMNKGFLERVEGNMLENYHRAKSWTKHMNHTYYKITREGRHYLRRLREESDHTEP